MTRATVTSGSVAGMSSPGGARWHATLAAILAVALGLGIALVSAPATATADFTLERLAGDNRTETANQIALATFPDGAGTVLLARADSFPDALAGNYAAGVLRAPLLLTGTNAVAPSTMDTIATLGATRAVLLGGFTVVSVAVATQLEGAGLEVSRLHGANRYETAAVIATSQDAGQVGTDDDGRRVAFLAAGHTFPDALAAGPLSYRSHVPLLLTERDRLSPAAASALQQLEIRHVVIIGGPGAVSTAVETDLTALSSSLAFQRVGGSDRFETTVLLAELGHAMFDLGTAHVDIAFGRNFPDALAGGPHAGQANGPILLTETGTAHPTTCAYLTANAATVAAGHVLGGTGVVSQAATVALEACGRDVGSTETPTEPTETETETDPPVQVPTPVLGQPSLAGTTLASRCENPDARFNHLFAGFDMHGPAAVLVTPAGRLFAVDFGGKRVLGWPDVDALQACQPADVVITGDDPNFAGPEALAMDSQGRLYIADTLSNTIQVYEEQDNGDWTLHARLGQPGVSGNGFNQFNFPRGIAIGPGDRLFVADDFNHRIMLFDQPIATGAFAVDSIGAGANGGWNHPKGVATIGDDLYVADYFGNRVLRFTGPFDTPDQVYVASAAFTGIAQPIDLAVWDDELFVTVHGPNPAVEDSVVAVYDAMGGDQAAPARTFTDEHIGPEALGITFDGDGRFYLSDYRRYRVLIYGPDAIEP